MFQLNSSWIESIMARKSRQEPGAANPVKLTVKRASKAEFDLKMFSFIIKNKQKHNTRLVFCLALKKKKSNPEELAYKLRALAALSENPCLSSTAHMVALQFQF